MKKLIALLTLFMAFSFSANAQENKKAQIGDAAKADVATLNAAVGLTETQQKDFLRLFAMKNMRLSDPNVTDQNRAEMAKVVTGKIRASLDSEQIAKLDADPTVIDKLVRLTKVSPTTEATQESIAPAASTSSKTHK